MSDFCKLGNALIDFDQVRMVEAVNDDGIRIHWADGREYVITDDNPVETITAAFNSTLERFKEQQKNGDMK